VGAGQGALSEAECGYLRAAIDADRAAQPQAWSLQGQERRVGYVPGDGDRRPEQRTGDGVGEIGESGRWASGPLLERSDAFDGFVAHPSVLGLCRALLGPATMCFNGLTATIREPVAAPPPPGRSSHWSLFHRENAASFLPTHPRCILSLQIQFYLNDCDETTHCFSVVKVRSLSFTKSFGSSRSQTNKDLRRRSRWRRSGRCRCGRTR